MMPIALLLRGLTGPFGLLLVVLALGLSGVRADGRPQPEAGSGFTARPIALGDRYMAVTTNPHATQAAVEMLARCGSALDAAIAAQLVLNVMEPQPSGIGGGGFLLHYDRASGRVQAYDGRETALATARPDRFLRPEGQALTSSIEDAFGSRLMVQGFLFNNQLTDFAFSPEQAGHAVANRVEGARGRSPPWRLPSFSTVRAGFTRCWVHSSATASSFVPSGLLRRHHPHGRW